MSLLVMKRVRIQLRLRFLTSILRKSFQENRWIHQLLLKPILREFLLNLYLFIYYKFSDGSPIDGPIMFIGDPWKMNISFIMDEERGALDKFNFTGDTQVISSENSFCMLIFVFSAFSMQLETVLSTI